MSYYCLLALNLVSFQPMSLDNGEEVLNAFICSSRQAIEDIMRCKLFTVARLTFGSEW